MSLADDIHAIRNGVALRSGDHISCVRVGGREVVMLTSNNYLGFANHPRVREAQPDLFGRGRRSIQNVRLDSSRFSSHNLL